VQVSIVSAVGFEVRDVLSVTVRVATALSVVDFEVVTGSGKLLQVKIWIFWQ